MKTPDVLNDLRNWLVSGAVGPGTRLPVREELEERYRLSRGTMQRVINQLTEEGFLIARGSKGMFVTEYPPHLFQFGIILPPRSESGFQDSLWRSLLELTQKRELLPAGTRFRVYQAEDGHDPFAVEEVWQQITQDIEARRLAGVMLLEHKRLPEARLRRLAGTRVVIFSHVEYEEPWLRSVWLDYSALIRQTVQEVRQAGCTTAAMLANLELPPEYVSEFILTAAAAGVRTRQEWVQGISLASEAFGWIGRIVRLLFSPNLQERPQALVVLNGNLTPYVMRALRELELDNEVLVVSHSNGDLHEKNVRCVCFDPRRLLECSLQVLRDWPDKHDGIWPRLVEPAGVGV